MVRNQSNETEAIDAIVTTPYKYGFTTNLETEEFEKGLNEADERDESKSSNNSANAETDKGSDKPV